MAGSLAAEQDRFWPLHDYLFANLQGENVGSFSLERLLAMGEAAGLDMERFRAGLQLEDARQRIVRIQGESLPAAAALGINATPTVTVAGVPLESPDFDTLSAAIELALGSQGTQPPPADEAQESPLAEAGQVGPAADPEGPTESG